MSLENLIQSTATKYSFDWQLFAALIMAESSGDQFAFEFEEGFFNTYIANKPLRGFVPRARPTEITERMLRASSFSFTQIMGETARELGFAENSLMGLLVPENNLEYGGRYLRHCLELSKGDQRRALLFWNGGKNLKYPDRVLEILDGRTFEGIL